MESAQAEMIDRIRRYAFRDGILEASRIIEEACLVLEKKGMHPKALNCIRQISTVLNEEATHLATVAEITICPPLQVTNPTTSSSFSS